MIMDTIYNSWMQIQLGRREEFLSPLVKTRGCYIFLGLNSRFQFMQRANQDIWECIYNCNSSFHYYVLKEPMYPWGLSLSHSDYTSPWSFHLPLLWLTLPLSAALGNGKDFFCGPHQVPFSAKLHILSRAFWWDEDSVATHLRSGGVL